MNITFIPAGPALFDDAGNLTSMTSFLGRGICSIDGDVRNWGVIRDEVAHNDKYEQTFSLVQIADYEQIIRQMSLSANAQFSAFAGTTAIKAAVEFAKTCRFEEYSLFVMVKVKIVSKTETLLTPRLTVEAATTLAENTPHFLRTYGDQYISDVEYGAEMYAIIQYLARTVEEKQSLLQSFSGSFGESSVSATFRTMASVLKSHTSLRQDVVMIGVNPTDFPEQNDVVEMALHLPSLIRDGRGSEKSFRFGRYTEVLGFPPGLPSPNFNKAQTKLQSLRDLLVKAEKTQNAFEFCRDYSAYFLNVNSVAVASSIDYLVDAKRRIDSAARLIILDPTQADAIEVPSVDFLALPPLPQRRQRAVIELKMQVLFCTLVPGGFPEGTISFSGEHLSISADSDIGANSFIESFSLEPVETLPGVQIQARYRWAADSFEVPWQSTDWMPAGPLNRLPSLGRLHGFGLRLVGPMANALSIRYQATDSVGNNWSAENGTEVGHWSAQSHVYEFHQWVVRNLKVELILR